MDISDSPAICVTFALAILRKLARPEHLDSKTERRQKIHYKNLLFLKFTLFKLFTLFKIKIC